MKKQDKITYKAEGTITDSEGHSMKFTNKDIVNLEIESGTSNKIINNHHAIKLQELVEEEWIRVQALVKKPMDSFTMGQYKIIRYLVETSKGIEPDYINTKSLEESEK